MMPEQVRYNMRYRGPMESHKTHQQKQQVAANLKRLKAAFEELQSELQSYQHSVYYGKTDNAVDEVIPVRLTNLALTLENTERGV